MPFAELGLDLKLLLLIPPTLIAGYVGLNRFFNNRAINRITNGGPMTMDDVRRLNNIHQKTGRSFPYDGDKSRGK